MDGIAALTVGLAVLGLKSVLSELFNLQEQLLLVQAVITLIYASYSTTLARKKIYSKTAVRILAIANLLYVVLAMVLLTVTFKETTILGKSYFLAEIIFISGLAIEEFKQLKYLK